MRQVDEVRVRIHRRDERIRVAAFNTRLPHWFGAAGDEPVEILSLISRQGEHIHVRAAPRRKANNA